VRCYVPGAAVVSTLPPFEGGLQPIARTMAYQRVRESLDPDDYTGHFAVWSGTSFAAPLFAGWLAADLVSSLEAPGSPGSRADAVARAWAAVAGRTDLTP
jgi:serine protease